MSRLSENLLLDSNSIITILPQLPNKQRSQSQVRTSNGEATTGTTTGIPPRDSSTLERRSTRSKSSNKSIFKNPLSSTSTNSLINKHNIKDVINSFYLKSPNLHLNRSSLKCSNKNDQKTSLSSKSMVNSSLFSLDKNNSNTNEAQKSNTLTRLPSKHREASNSPVRSNRISSPVKQQQQQQHSFATEAETALREAKQKSEQNHQRFIRSNTTSDCNSSSIIHERNDKYQNNRFTNEYDYASDSASIKLNVSENQAAAASVSAITSPRRSSPLCPYKHHLSPSLKGHYSMVEDEKMLANHLIWNRASNSPENIEQSNQNTLTRSTQHHQKSVYFNENKMETTSDLLQSNQQNSNDNSRLSFNNNDHHDIIIEHKVTSSLTSSPAHHPSPLKHSKVDSPPMTPSLPPVADKIRQTSCQLTPALATITSTSTSSSSAIGMNHCQRHSSQSQSPSRSSSPKRNIKLFNTDNTNKSTTEFNLSPNICCYHSTSPIRNNSRLTLQQQQPIKEIVVTTRSAFSASHRISSCTRIDDKKVEKQTQIESSTLLVHSEDSDDNNNNNNRSPVKKSVQVKVFPSNLLYDEKKKKTTTTKSSVDECVSTTTRRNRMESDSIEWKLKNNDNTTTTTASPIHHYSPARPCYDETPMIITKNNYISSNNGDSAFILNSDYDDLDHNQYQYQRQLPIVTEITKKISNKDDFGQSHSHSYSHHQHRHHKKQEKEQQQHYINDDTNSDNDHEIIDLTKKSRSIVMTPLKCNHFSSGKKQQKSHNHHNHHHHHHHHHQKKYAEFAGSCNINNKNSNNSNFYKSKTFSPPITTPLSEFHLSSACNGIINNTNNNISQKKTINANNNSTALKESSFLNHYYFENSNDHLGGNLGGY
jgi:hypothetical protein